MRLTTPHSASHEMKKLVVSPSVAGPVVKCGSLAARPVRESGLHLRFGGEDVQQDVQQDVHQGPGMKEDESKAGLLEEVSH